MLDEKKHVKCPICESVKTQKWGVRNDKQRYRCPACNYNFTVSNEGVSLNNQFVWFRKWVMERQVYKYLVRDSGMSQSSLQRLFTTYLKSPPKNLIKSKGKVHLLIDGSYFSNGLCLVLYYDCKLQYVQLFRQTNNEKYKEIKEDLENLKKPGVEVYSVTCDGHKAILKAVTKVYPNALIQRCLVHVKRQLINYLSNRPKSPQAVGLLSIARTITHVKSMESASYWLLRLHQWNEQNSAFVEEKAISEETGRWWYKHKNLHQASTHLMNAIPHLFACLNDPDIASTTNELEGYFAHLKEKLTLHRGVRFESVKSFIKWYIHFKNNPAK